MNPLDLGVIGVVLLSAIFAFARGFVRETLSIVAWIGAAAIAFYGFDWAEALIDAHAHNPLLSQIAAAGGLFVISLIVLTILTGFVARLVHAVGLTPIDRTLGLIFGLARGAFFVCLAYLLLDVYGPQAKDQPDWIRDAKSKPFLHQGAELLQSYLPESLKSKAFGAAGDLLGNVDAEAPAELAKRASSALVKPTPPAAKPGQNATPAYGTKDLNRLIQDNTR
jgi:membrane protein required for colicin V production